MHERYREREKDIDREGVIERESERKRLRGSERERKGEIEIKRFPITRRRSLYFSIMLDPPPPADFASM